jgi:hypothetical protein
LHEIERSGAFSGTDGAKAAILNAAHPCYYGNLKNGASTISLFS